MCSSVENLPCVSFLHGLIKVIYGNTFWLYQKDDPHCIIQLPYKWRSDLSALRTDGTEFNILIIFDKWIISMILYFVIRFILIAHLFLEVGVIALNVIGDPAALDETSTNFAEKNSSQNMVIVETSIVNN